MVGAMLNTVSFRLSELWQQLLTAPLALLPWLQMVVLSLAMPLAVGVLLLLTGRWLMGSWRWAFMFSMVGTTMLFGMAGYWPSRVAPLPDNGITFRIAHVNALVYSNVYGPKLDFIRTANAEITSVVEAHPDFIKDIEVLTTAYPHKQVVGQNTLLLSKWPLKKLETFSNKAALYQVNPPGAAPFHVLHIHPTAPSTPARLAERNALWQQLAAANLPQPLVMVGDANTAPWDPVLTTFAKQNNLQQKNWLPTFPSLIPLTPIDLLLTPPEWKATLRRVYVPETDHLGWVADITL